MQQSISIELGEKEEYKIDLGFGRYYSLEFRWGSLTLARFWQVWELIKVYRVIGFSQ